ncbi:MAG: hypothetical protein QY311_02465 [Candidatus Paceibacterota bacterium]|nr:MAG: hypothetical protein QY311_02465 [Candidatus Paceibacterota bacterium]
MQPEGLLNDIVGELYANIASASLPAANIPALTSEIASRASAFEQARFLFDTFSVAFSVVKGIGMILSVALGAVLIWIAYKWILLNSEAVATPEASTPDALPEPAEGGPFQARWDEIVRHMESPQEAQWKLAIVEADTLLDLALARAGFPGSSIGDRLMRITDGQLPGLDDIWGAHKIRNRIAHDIGFTLSYAQMRSALNAYERVLQDLGAIRS